MTASDEIFKYLPVKICLKCKIGMEDALRLKTTAWRSHRQLQGLYSIKEPSDEEEEIEEQVEEEEFESQDSQLDPTEEASQGYEEEVEEQTAMEEDFLDDPFSQMNDEEYKKPVIQRTVKRKEKKSDHAFGEKKYKCDFCSKTYCYSSSLGVHMKSHTGERNYKCQDCGQAFVSGTILKQHVRRHTGEKPYTCTLCEKSFTQRGTLERHIRKMHQKGKLFACKVCGKGFMKADSVRKHISTVHPEKGEETFWIKDIQQSEKEKKLAAT